MLPANERVRRLGKLLGMLKPVPPEWAHNPGGTPGRVELELLPCSDWRELRMGWERAMHWIPGMERAMTCMLAAAMSTRLLGDQLWVMVISPPSTGKTVLCEALSVNRTYVKALDTLRGFYSGYQSDKEGVEDTSLVPQIRNKTLVVKDGDGLLSAPNREHRGLYDTAGRSSFRNKTSREYEGVRFSFVLCGTPALRQLDGSELGERFVVVRVVDEIDDDLEDEIGLRKINQLRYHRAEADGRADSLDGPEMIKVKRLTGGYVDHLRRNALDLYRAVEMGDEAARLVTRYGKFVALLRSRPSKKQEEEVCREMSTRLVSQLGRLALCAAAVWQRPAVDADVLALVRRVALDTARGLGLDVVRYVASQGRKGAFTAAIAPACHMTEPKAKDILHHLRRLKVLAYLPAAPGAAAGARNAALGGGAVTGTPRLKWYLTERMARLYEEVCSGEEIS
jgi:hypothetical protein